MPRARIGSCDRDERSLMRFERPPTAAYATAAWSTTIDFTGLSTASVALPANAVLSTSTDRLEGRLA